MPRPVRLAGNHRAALESMALAGADGLIAPNRWITASTLIRHGLAAKVPANDGATEHHAIYRLTDAGRAALAKHTPRIASCDGCGKHRRDVRSCGRDSNGAPDAPDLCFICRAEGTRGRTYDRAAGCYVPIPTIAEYEPRAAP